MGKLIVIEGLDGCGKSTQLQLLIDRLTAENVDFRAVSFPNYASAACEPVKMYLAGDFGQKPNDVNAYAASTLYAVDRYASFKTDWGDFYDRGGLIVCARYVTSNAIHQCSKLPQEQWTSFTEWLYDFEYCKMGIPKPDCVLFLKMPPEMSEKLLLKRYKGNADLEDIHEKDRAYQEKCREAALFSAAYGHWIGIDCTENEEFRSREAIHDEIYKNIQKYL